MPDPILIKKFKNAVQLERKGDYSQAMLEYFSIIEGDKNYRGAYLNIGSLYSRMNRLKDAMKFYKKALSLKKDYVTFFNIGSIFYKTNEMKNAIINLEKSKYLNGSFVLSSLVLGLSFSKLSNYKAAETNFINVLKIMPNNRVALTALAILFYNQDKYEKSIKLLNKLITLNSSNIKIRELKSNILFKTGKIDESVVEIKSIKKISDGYKYYDEYIKSVPVEAYTDRYGTINEKISILEESASNDKNSLISLSLCHLFKGETDKAIEYLFQVKKQSMN